MYWLFSLYRYIAIIIVVQMFAGCSSKRHLRTEQPEQHINYRHLNGVLNTINETAIKKPLKTLAVLDFSDANGMPSDYSRQFNRELHRKLDLFSLQTDSLLKYKIIPYQKFKSILDSLQIKDIGFIQAFDIKHIKKVIPTLDAIVTGSVSSDADVEIIIFRSDGEIINIEEGITNMINRIVKKVHGLELGRLLMYPLYDLSTREQSGFGVYMTEKIQIGLLNAGIEIINQADTTLLIKAREFQESILFDDRTKIHFGKFVNARSILTGTIAGNPSSSWEVHIRLLDVEKGVGFWGDSFVNVDRNVIQLYLPYQLSNTDTLYLNDSEKRLIHRIISDLKLNPAEKDYYVSSIVSLSQIRRNSELNPDERYMMAVSEQLGVLRNDMETSMENEVNVVRKDRLVKVDYELKGKRETFEQWKKNEEEAIKGLRQKEEERLRKQYESLSKRIAELKESLGSKDYGLELKQILSEFQDVMRKVESALQQQMPKSSP